MTGSNELSCSFITSDNSLYICIIDKPTQELKLTTAQFIKYSLGFFLSKLLKINNLMKQIVKLIDMFTAS